LIMSDEPGLKDLNTTAAGVKTEYIPSTDELERLETKQKLDLRTVYAVITMFGVAAWMVLIGFSILLSLLNWKYITPFSDKVIITMVSGCTLNILGMYAIVLKFLFKEHK